MLFLALAKKINKGQNALNSLVNTSCIIKPLYRGQCLLSREQKYSVAKLAYSILLNDKIPYDLHLEHILKGEIYYSG